jgi:hypothetical protein
MSKAIQAEPDEAIKVIQAEYDQATNSLRLQEPLEGFANHEIVSVIIQHEVTPEDVPQRPWMKFRGILEGEDAESFGRAIDEAFPIDPVRK